MTKIDGFVRSYNGKMTLGTDKKPYLRYTIPNIKGTPAQNLLYVTGEVLRELQKLTFS